MKEFTLTNFKICRRHETMQKCRHQLRCEHNERRPEKNVWVAKDWRMLFNIDKCSVMHTGKMSIENFPFRNIREISGGISGTPLSIVEFLHSTCAQNGTKLPLHKGIREWWMGSVTAHGTDGILLSYMRYTVASARTVHFISRIGSLGCRKLFAAVKQVLENYNNEGPGQKVLPPT